MEAYPEKQVVPGRVNDDSVCLWERGCAGPGFVRRARRGQCTCRLRRVYVDARLSQRRLKIHTGHGLDCAGLRSVLQSRRGCHSKTGKNGVPVGSRGGVKMARATKTGQEYRYRTCPGTTTPLAVLATTMKYWQRECNELEFRLPRYRRRWQREIGGAGLEHLS